jgi:hypothetical protein
VDIGDFIIIIVACGSMLEGVQCGVFVAEVF